MIEVIAAITGLTVGALTARRRGGNRLDMLQYGAIFAIIFAVVALFATISLSKLI